MCPPPPTRLLGPREGRGPGPEREGGPAQGHTGSRWLANSQSSQHLWVGRMERQQERCHPGPPGSWSSRREDQAEGHLFQLSQPLKSPSPAPAFGMDTPQQRFRPNTHPYPGWYLWINLSHQAGQWCWVSNSRASSIPDSTADPLCVSSGN